MASQNTDPAAASSTAALKGGQTSGSVSKGSVTKRFGCSVGSFLNDSFILNESLM
uniref:Uncharacterized protein n=1 Tax=Sinocyclocheilus grahami TaxID=75366 RepID=A0A672KC34_SINGR